MNISVRVDVCRGLDWKWMAFEEMSCERDWIGERVERSRGIWWFIFSEGQAKRILRIFFLFRLLLLLCRPLLWCLCVYVCVLVFFSIFFCYGMAASARNEGTRWMTWARFFFACVCVRVRVWLCFPDSFVCGGRPVWCGFRTPGGSMRSLGKGGRRGFEVLTSSVGELNCRPAFFSFSLSLSTELATIFASRFVFSFTWLDSVLT